MILSLKALGNIGASRSVAEKLLNCARPENNDVQVRIAAIQALRRVPCRVDNRVRFFLLVILLLGGMPLRGRQQRFIEDAEAFWQIRH